MAAIGRCVLFSPGCAPPTKGPPNLIGASPCRAARFDLPVPLEGPKDASSTHEMEHDEMRCGDAVLHPRRQMFGSPERSRYSLGGMGSEGFASSLLPFGATRRKVESPRAGGGSWGVGWIWPGQGNRRLRL